MSIRQKIQFGFFAIGFLLLLGGVISALELTRFSRASRQASAEVHDHIEASIQMLDATQLQNTMLLLRITDTIRHQRYDSIINLARTDFEKAYRNASVSVHDSASLAVVRKTFDFYQDNIANADARTQIDWFTDVYQSAYQQLTGAIKEFLVEGQDRLNRQIGSLQMDAYRTTMVGIISLGGGLLLLLIFYFMINSYIISPILRVNRSLDNYIGHRLPYDVKIKTRDELGVLNDNITTVVLSGRKSKPENR